MPISTESCVAVQVRHIQKRNIHMWGYVKLPLFINGGCFFGVGQSLQYESHKMYNRLWGARTNGDCSAQNGPNSGCCVHWIVIRTGRTGFESPKTNLLMPSAKHEPNIYTRYIVYVPDICALKLRWPYSARSWPHRWNSHSFSVFLLSIAHLPGWLWAISPIYATVRGPESGRPWYRILAENLHEFLAKAKRG